MSQNFLWCVLYLALGANAVGQKPAPPHRHPREVETVKVIRDRFTDKESFRVDKAFLNLGADSPDTGLIFCVEFRVRNPLGVYQTGQFALLKKRDGQITTHWDQEGYDLFCYVLPDPKVARDLGYEDLTKEVQAALKADRDAQ